MKAPAVAGAKLPEIERSVSKLGQAAMKAPAVAGAKAQARRSSPTRPDRRNEGPGRRRGEAGEDRVMRPVAVHPDAAMKAPAVAGAKSASVELGQVRHVAAMKAPAVAGAKLFNSMTDASPLFTPQ